MLHSILTKPIACMEVHVCININLFWIALMMEAASTSETSVNFYQTAQHNNPEYSHLHLFIFIQKLKHHHHYA
jgi:hypothetical protein